MPRPRTIQADIPTLLDPALTAKPFRWDEIFGNSNPVELEVGSGKGLFLANAATVDPACNFFGIEIARKYAGLAALRVHKKELGNVRVWPGDAKAVLSEMVPARSLRAVHVYFPDPWWKKRHKKRRVFCDSLVESIRRCLRIGGILSVATDVEEYFQVIRELLASRTCFHEMPVDEVTAPEHDHDYLTNFERKFRIQGRSIHRVRYRLEDEPEGGETA
jgi:tRNA (guanine-N7-)-methyltransferase